jgi:hypothetical protein
MRKLVESISGASQIAVNLLLYPLLRGRRRRWGATEDEKALRLPGDELVPDPDWRYDHAISIDAPPSAVWPWLVQLGQGRGGFYAYEGLENLIGCQIRNVAEIQPQLQSLDVGDTIVLHGRSGFGPEVVRLDPGRTLVLGGPPRRRGGSRREPGVRPLPDGPDRLRDEQEDAPEPQEARRSLPSLKNPARFSSHPAPGERLPGPHL